MYYAFQYTDGTNTTTNYNDKIVIAGQLFRFISKELRDAWVGQGYNYRSDKFRQAVATRTLPHGWNTGMAVTFLEEEQKCLDIMKDINEDWLDPCEMGSYEHWAYAEDARSQDEFSARLRTCDSKAEIRKLQKEERESIRTNCDYTKDLIFEAMAMSNVGMAEDKLHEARRIWGAYGSSQEVDAIERLIISTEEDIPCTLFPMDAHA